LTDTEDLNRALWIVAFSFMGVHLIYMIINTICFCKTNYRTGGCFRCNNIVYSSIFLALSCSFWIMTLINFIRIATKVQKLNAWAEFSPCVDTYLQISDYQKDELESVGASAIGQLVLSCFIFIVCLVNFFG